MKYLCARCLIAIMVALILGFLVLLLLGLHYNQYHLSVAHFNDYLSSISATDKSGKICEDSDINCVGGFSRLVTVIENLKLRDNFVLFNVGNTAAGSLWFEVFKWNFTVSLMNQIPIDAISIAFHDFDNGLEELREAIEKMFAPVVVCNLDTSEEPGFDTLIKKSIVIERSRRKIGVIGVMSRFVASFSNVGKLIVLDELQSIEKEAKTLVKKGVFTNILLCYGGYSFSKELAASLSKYLKIRLIIGGFSKNILYDGSTSAPVLVEGPYPTVIVKDNIKVLCVHAGEKGIFIGNLSVIYDSNGNVIKWDGNPIYLDSKIEPDSYSVRQIKPNLETIREKGSEVIGSTSVLLDSEDCFRDECQIGDLFADMMFDAVGTAQGSMVMAHSFTGKIKPGKITYNDLWSMYSLNDQICTIEILGKYIVFAFEESLTPTNMFAERIYQVSKILVNISLLAKPGKRVLTKSIVDAFSPTDLDLEKKYTIAVNSYSIEGKKNLQILRNFHHNKKMLLRTFPNFVKYIGKRSPIQNMSKWRIRNLDPSRK